MKAILKFSMLFFCVGVRLWAEEPSSAKVVSAKIEASELANIPDDSNLVITNIGPNPIKICTITQPWVSIWKGGGRIALIAGDSKSNAPSEEVIARSIKTLKHGESAFIRFAQKGNLSTDGDTEVSYLSPEPLAKKYGLWQGKVSLIVKLPEKEKK